MLAIVANTIDDYMKVELVSAQKQKLPIYIFYSQNEHAERSIAAIKNILLQYQNTNFIPKVFNENIPNSIYTNIANELVSKFKSNISSLPINNYGNNVDVSNIFYEDIVDKKTIELFKGCEDFLLYKYYPSYGRRDNKKDDIRELCNIGKGVLEWIIEGNSFPVSSDITYLVNILDKENSWLEKRWQCIKYYNEENFPMAMEYAEKALNIAKENSAPEWIINDILIDCRNINLKLEPFSYSKYQKELIDSNQIAVLPTGDRYKYNIYDYIVREDFRLDTLPISSRALGGNFSETLNDFQNYIFSSIIYGSCTHISLSRELLANILYEYGKIYEDNHLLFSAFKLLIISGKSKEIDLFINKYWDYIYNDVVNNVDSIWDFCNKVIGVNKSSIKITILKNFYAYFSEDKFDEISFDIKIISNYITRNNSDKLLEAINICSSRMKHNCIIDIVINIMDNNALLMGGNLSRILLKINIEGVIEDKLSKLSSLINDNLELILSHNGTIQFIANLIKQNEVYLSLEKNKAFKLYGIQEQFYKYNKGEEESFLETISSLIKEAQKQFDANNNSSNTWKGFAHQPLVTMCKIINQDFELDMVSVLEDKFITFFNKLMSTAYFFDMKVNALDVESEIFKYYLSFNKFCDKEKICLSESIMYYMKYNKNNKEINNLIVSIVFVLSNELISKVRENACICLGYLYNTKHNDVAEAKMYQLLLDTSHNVRYNLLRVVRDNIIPKDSSCSKTIIGTLKDDPHYNIRNQAMQL